VSSCWFRRRPRVRPSHRHRRRGDITLGGPPGIRLPDARMVISREDEEALGGLTTAVDEANKLAEQAFRLAPGIKDA
jgi:hypothetical protein